MASSMVTLFGGGVLLGMLLAISGAASPWAGEDGSQLASHQSFLANNGVRSVMKRGTEEVKRKSKKKSGPTEKKKKKKKGEKCKGKKSEKGKGKKNGKKRNGGKSKRKSK